MIFLHTASAGSGKTQKIVSMLRDELEQDNPRPIYANIAGLKLAHEPLPADWRDCPPGSIIIYDEAQGVLIDGIYPFAAETRKVHDQVKDLSIHRSTYGVEIHFISQSTKFLNKYVLENAGTHFYYDRVLNQERTRIYMWNEWRTPSKTDFREARDERIFNFDESLYELYDSAPDHNHKKQRSSKLLGLYSTAAVLILIIGGGFVWSMFSAKDNIDKVNANDTNQQQTAQTTFDKATAPLDAASYTQSVSFTDNQALEMSRIAMVVAGNGKCRARYANGMIVPMDILPYERCLELSVYPYKMQSSFVEPVIPDYLADNDGSPPPVYGLDNPVI